MTGTPGRYFEPWSARRLRHDVSGSRAVTSPGKGATPGVAAAERRVVCEQYDLGPTDPPSTLGLLARGARPRQWLKNLLVLMAPAAAGRRLGEWHTTLRVVAAFLIFCSWPPVPTSSTTWWTPDRIRTIPPSGGVPWGKRRVATRDCPRRRVGPRCNGPRHGAARRTLGIRHRRRCLYAGLSTRYSIRLKREPVVELAVVASCFVLRAVAGGVVVGVPLSNWFLVFTSFAALFIVTGKRSAENDRLGDDAGFTRGTRSVQPVFP